MKHRIGEPPMADPLGFFITWATYGTWLPGDGRGWVLSRRGWQLPDPVRELETVAKMTETACRLDLEQRRAVEGQIAETCLVCGWQLHAVNCRSNHLHVVVSADKNPKRIRSALKAWCTRRLKALEAARLEAAGVSGPIRENWWAERGSQRFIDDEDSFEAAVLYVLDGQGSNNHR
jgi:REP element-mobilizing transposase RayT